MILPPPKQPRQAPHDPFSFAVLSRLPLAESEYDRFLTDRSYAEDRLEELYKEFAALFPDAFPWG